MSSRPPPPPGLGPDVVEWIVWLVILVIVGVLVVVLIKYILEKISTSSQYQQPLNYQQASQLPLNEALMRELLEEIRLLRKEIRELREELRE